jgi:hypothetical protein
MRAKRRPHFVLDRRGRGRDFRAVADNDLLAANSNNTRNRAFRPTVRMNASCVTFTKGPYRRE